MDAPLRAFIELRGYGARGPRYQIRMNRPDGMVLLDGSIQPLYDAARVLHSRGIGGHLEIWDAQRSYCRMHGDIERLAGLTVSEGQLGMVLKRYIESEFGTEFSIRTQDDSMPILEVAA